MSIFAEVGADSATPEASAELVKLIGERFISRKDVKARETSSGAWMPVTDTGKADGNRLPFTMQNFQDHIAGRKTYGHYLLGTDNTCKLFAYDIDLDKTGWWIDPGEPGIEDLAEVMERGQHCNPREVWAAQDPPEAIQYFTMALRGIADGLAAMIHRLGEGAVHTAIADSGGKGLHVYGFTGPMPASHVREFAMTVLTHFDLFEPLRGDNFWKVKQAGGAYSNVTIEVFPKQDTLDGKDLGNLMRLPLGVNQKTGRRGHFIQASAQPNRLVEMDPLRALSGDLPWE